MVLTIRVKYYKNRSMKRFAISAFLVALHLAVMVTAVQSSASAAFEAAENSMIPWLKAPAQGHQKFEPRVKMQFGKFKGKPIDVSWARPAVVLESTQAADSAEVEMVKIANFRHDKKFWYAWIPVGQIDKALFQYEYFAFPGRLLKHIRSAHGQIRFLLKPDAAVILEPMHDQSLAPVTLRDFILTLDYAAPKGVKFTPENTLFPQNTTWLIHFTSPVDRYESMVVKQDHLVEQMILKMNPSESRSLVMKALEWSQWKSYTEKFHLFTNNCVTKVYDLLDEVFAARYSQEGRMVKEWNVAFDIVKAKVRRHNLDPIAGAGKVALFDRGLIEGRMQKRPGLQGLLGEKDFFISENSKYLEWGKEMEESGGKLYSPYLEIRK